MIMVDPGLCLSMHQPYASLLLLNIKRYFICIMFFVWNLIDSEHSYDCISYTFFDKGILILNLHYLNTTL